MLHVLIFSATYLPPCASVPLPVLRLPMKSFILAMVVATAAASSSEVHHARLSNHTNAISLW